MQDSHTAASIDETTADPSPLRLVPTAAIGLPEWLAGRVDEHLAVFAAHDPGAAGRLDRGRPGGHG
jgi:hypothetical protein